MVLNVNQFLHFLLSKNFAKWFYPGCTNCLMTFKLLYVPGHCCGYNSVSCQLWCCQTIINNSNHCAPKKSQIRQLVLKKNVSNSVAFQFAVGHFLLLRKFACFPADQCNISQNRLRMRRNTTFLSAKEQKNILFIFFCFALFKKKVFVCCLKSKCIQNLPGEVFFSSNLASWRRLHSIKIVIAEGRGSVKAQKRWNWDKQSFQDFQSAAFPTVHFLMFPLLFIAALFLCSLIYLMCHHSDCAFIPSKWNRLSFLHTKDAPEHQCWYEANNTALVLETLCFYHHTCQLCQYVLKNCRILEWTYAIRHKNLILKYLKV